MLRIVPIRFTLLAALAAGGSVEVPPTYAGTDAFTNTQGIRVEDLRGSGAQQHERSVKEFGAVCNGVADDTAALQAAINFAQAQAVAGRGVALTLPAGVCKTHQLVWHLESIGGQGRQVSGLMGYPGEDVLATVADATNLLGNTRLHDLTIYVDQSLDVSCTPAQGRAAAGSCGANRPMETGSIFSAGGNGLAGIAGTGSGWWIGNCAIAIPAMLGTGGNGLKMAEIENVAIATVGTDPLAAYASADSTHTCGIYMAQWPAASDFRNIDIRGVGTGIAVPWVAAAGVLGVTADSNRWQNVTISAVHGFAAAVGSNGVLDDVVVNAVNSAAVGEAPTGLVGANAILETVAEPQQISAAQAMQDFRWQLTNTQSGAASSVAPRVQPEPTGRMILAPSNNSFPPGVTNSDSGELCLKGTNVGFSDEWCMRAIEQAYPSGGTMPRYMAMENDGYAGFSGLTAVQMPGLRVRPGQISSSDTTLPVTDFASQPFAIAAGTVLGETCTTVPGISAPNAAATDGVLFVRAPGAIGQLQLTGSVTAAGTMTLTACNPSTAAQNYPAGTYYAFLLAGAGASTTPSVSEGTPTATNPLTTSQGDLVVGDGSGNPSRLGGNTTTTPAVLVQTGTGPAATAPGWQTAPTFYGGNLTGLNASNLTTGAVGIGNGGTGATTALQALTNLGGASLNASVSNFAGALSAKQIGAAFQVDQFAGADIGAKLTACIAGLSSAYGGTCDARNFTGTVAMGANVTINVANTTILLPCATISTSSSFIVPAGVRNVTLKGCGLRGASTASGSQGGTVLLYSGTGDAMQVGDPTYAVDTMGFHLDDAVINTTGSSSTATSGVVAYRVQEMELASLYFLGNGNQAGLVVDGTGNYAGGTFYDLAFNGFQVAVSGIGHQLSNPATTDWLNASTFLRVHINCRPVREVRLRGRLGSICRRAMGTHSRAGMWRVAPPRCI
jgi:hypothetical protein